MVEWLKAASAASEFVGGGKVTASIALIEALTAKESETAAILGRLDRLLEQPFRAGCHNLEQAALYENERRRQEMLETARGKFIEALALRPDPCDEATVLFHLGMLDILVGEERAAKAHLGQAYTIVLRRREGTRLQQLQQQIEARKPVRGILMRPEPSAKHAVLFLLVLVETVRTLGLVYGIRWWRYRLATRGVRRQLRSSDAREALRLVELDRKHQITDLERQRFDAAVENAYSAVYYIGPA